VLPLIWGVTLHLNVFSAFLQKEKQQEVIEAIKNGTEEGLKVV
jgi:hypothetical protein